MARVVSQSQRTRGSDEGGVALRRWRSVVGHTVTINLCKGPLGLAASGGTEIAWRQLVNLLQFRHTPIVSEMGSGFSLNYRKSPIRDM